MADSNDQTEKTFYDPNWIAGFGGWIHANNVLFYFAQSPFFDKTSGNQTLISQCVGNPQRENEVLGTRQRYEANLRKQRGVQYVVAYDPLEARVFIDGANGPEQSNVWVIRKQLRHQVDDDNVTTLGYYHIVNDVIYQSPSVAGVLNYRLLNTMSSLNKLFSTAKEFPYFSAAGGYSYQKPGQKTIPSNSTEPSSQSKEATPMPGTQPSTQDHHQSQQTDFQGTQLSIASGNNNNNSVNSRTLQDALQMTLRYGKEYMDDMPLVGEPGNFRFSRSKDVQVSQVSQRSTQQQQQSSTTASSTTTSQTPLASSSTTRAVTNGTSPKQPAKSPSTGLSQDVELKTSSLKRRKSRGAVA